MPDDVHSIGREMCSIGYTKSDILSLLLCLYFTHIMCSLRMGLVSRIKGPPFHGDKILYHDASPRFLSCHWFLCTSLSYSCMHYEIPYNCIIYLSLGLMYHDLWIRVVKACGHYFSWYIGWKPIRKFRSRFRMDGSAVCTWDTIPRTTWKSIHMHVCAHISCIL